MELSSAAGPRLPPSPAAAPAAPGLAPDQPLSEVFAEPANACAGLLKRLVNVKPHEYRRPERPDPRCPGQDGVRRVGPESAAELRPRGRAAQRTEPPESWKQAALHPEPCGARRARAPPCRLMRLLAASCPELDPVSLPVAIVSDKARLTAFNVPGE